MLTYLVFALGSVGILLSPHSTNAVLLRDVIQDRLPRELQTEGSPLAKPEPSDGDVVRTAVADQAKSLAENFYSLLGRLKGQTKGKGENQQTGEQETQQRQTQRRSGEEDEKEQDSPSPSVSSRRESSELRGEEAFREALEDILPSNEPGEENIEGSISKKRNSDSEVAELDRSDLEELLGSVGKTEKSEDGQQDDLKQEKSEDGQRDDLKQEKSEDGERDDLKQEKSEDGQQDDLKQEKREDGQQDKDDLMKQLDESETTGDRRRVHNFFRNLSLKLKPKPSERAKEEPSKDEEAAPPSKKGDVSEPIPVEGEKKEEQQPSELEAPPISDIERESEGAEMVPPDQVDVILDEAVQSAATDLQVNGALLKTNPEMVVYKVLEEVLKRGADAVSRLQDQARTKVKEIHSSGKEHADRIIQAAEAASKEMKAKAEQDSKEIVQNAKTTLEKALADLSAVDAASGKTQ